MTKIQITPIGAVEIILVAPASEIMSFISAITHRLSPINVTHLRARMERPVYQHLAHALVTVASVGPTTSEVAASTCTATFELRLAMLAIYKTVMVGGTTAIHTCKSSQKTQMVTRSE